MSVYEGLSESQQFACRVIADHARATAFAIADGILPGNEGRNYVLRKIMRRAIYHGREHLGLTDPFFYKVCDFVVGEMSGAYPELETQREFIGKMVRLEEERFGSTMTVGLKKLKELFGQHELRIPLQTLKSEQEWKVMGASPEIITLFKALAPLNDTYGLPRDLIRVILEDNDVIVPPNKFSFLFDYYVRGLQGADLRGPGTEKRVQDARWSEVENQLGSTEFLGYELTAIDEAKILAIFPQLEGTFEEVYEIFNGEKVVIILDKTPFYAESGGQIGDKGYVIHKDVKFVVNDTRSTTGGLILHYSTAECRDEISRSDLSDAIVRAIVDVEKRDATRRNHTATHLVHAALKEVLGSHVKQAGSIVAPNYLRFDFTHYQPMSDAEIAEVEDLVNRYVLQNEPVTTNVMALEDAMRSGAVAMFGEKYGGEVRVLSVGDGAFSKELCGGTHVRATGDIGSFKITADEAIASGVRRIRAITGFDAFERFREDEKLIERSLHELNTQRDNLPNAIAKLQEELKKTRKEMDELKLKIAMGQQSAVSCEQDEARDVAGIKVLGKIVDGLDANGQRQLSDTLLARLKSGVVVLGRSDEGKVGIIVRVSDDLTGRVKAGDIIREIAPIVGGRGGGKADMAEGGGTEPGKLSEAIEASYGVIERMLA